MLNNLRSNLQSADSSRKILLIIVLIGTLASAAVLGSKASPLWLGLILALFGGLLLVEKPEWGLPVLVLVAFFVPFEAALSGGVSANGVLILLPILAVLWLLRALQSGRIYLVKSRTYWPLLAFLVVAVLSWLAGNMTWSPFYPQPANLLFVQLGQWAIYAFSFVAYVLAAQQSVKALKWVVLAFIVLGTFVLVLRYGGPLGRTIDRVVETTAYSNGSFFVWLTALAGGQAIFNRQLRRNWRVALMAVALAVPLLGFLQNADWASSWLPPLVVVLILLWLRSRSLSVATLVLLIAGILVFSSIILQVYDWEFERSVSVAGRFVLWQSVLDLAIDKPILGLGLTTYHQYHRFIPLLTENGRWWEPNVNSHNLYIDIFAQLGVIGLVVFFWIVAEVGGLAWRLRSQFADNFQAGYVASAFAGLVGILIASAIVEWLLPFVYNVGFRGFRISVFSWIFLGGLVVLEQMAYSEQPHLDDN